MFEDFEKKDSVVVVYTGDGKGKTSASLGLMVRALGTGWKVAYVQFVKHWEVGEHKAIAKMQEVFGDDLVLHKGGKGFYNAGEMSAKDVSEDEHRKAAEDTFKFALDSVESGDFDLVICDEINNSVNDGLLDADVLIKLIEKRNDKTSLCLTGRNFPQELIELTDIATDMAKIKHHFDDKFLANEGIDF